MRPALFFGASRSGPCAPFIWKSFVQIWHWTVKALPSINEDYVGLYNSVVQM